MRQIVLDTETTGLRVEEGHRIIEIGCVELVGRKLTGNHFHQYMNPEREVDAGAVAVHGLTNEVLMDKPVFHRVAQSLMDFIAGAELIIHNAPFDLSFLNNELILTRQNWKSISNIFFSLLYFSESSAIEIEHVAQLLPSMYSLAILPSSLPLKYSTHA